MDFDIGWQNSGKHILFMYSTYLLHFHGLDIISHLSSYDCWLQRPAWGLILKLCEQYTNIYKVDVDVDIGKCECNRHSVPQG